MEVLLQAHTTALEKEPKLPTRIVLQMVAVDIVREDAAHTRRKRAFEHAIYVRQAQVLLAAWYDSGRTRRNPDIRSSKNGFAESIAPASSSDLSEPWTC
ncbi:3-oxoadipate enol-lactonase, putative [Babesia ovis]|uniref:3-oxoadipate enol-lactonase, putative n=1 Tax=Babesia ovis TaxID=5869 RepID=A0A9W5TC63_BABOV|nr:3-oxoadipate enol-lactonase, putative [Babesia ovis]